jgi:ribonuclease HII
MALSFGAGGGLGSGYPSDPKTKLFVKKSIKRNQDISFLRKSWKPVQILMKKRKLS